MPSCASTAYLRRGHGVEFEMEAAWVRRHLPSTACTLADVGCGNGGLFPWLESVDVIGFDYSCAGLLHAREQYRNSHSTPPGTKMGLAAARPCGLKPAARYRKTENALERTPGTRVVCAHADRLPLPDQSVDVVAAQHVMEHMPDAEAAIREWRRILRPGGALLILTPNAAFTDPSVFDDPTHVRLFRAQDLRAIVSGAGLLVDEIRTLGLPWFRDYRRYPGGWRLRRFITTHADRMSSAPLCRWRGQTLCCAATRGETL